MQYFFTLGSNPTLSLAELAAVFNRAGGLSLVRPDVAILETNQSIAADILKKIGGTIKFGLIYDTIDAGRGRDLSLPSLTQFAPPSASAGKFFFGISYYGKIKFNTKALAMEFKKLLKNSGINSRWVTCRGERLFTPTLSSVVVEQNKLTSARGAEIVIIQSGKQLLLGKTLAVQPFKELSFRDYGRPNRDDRSGMLPPKLAQIMINLAICPPCKGGLGGLNFLREERKKGIEDLTILDPFCGSGTILTEAALMGYRNIIGADISKKAIKDTKTNFEWIQQNFKFKISNLKLINIDVGKISKHLPLNSIDAIVTEPYLGPQRGQFDINKIVKELEQLYSQSLIEFKKILKPGGRVVMAWPVFQTKIKPVSLNPNLTDFKIINPLPENLRANPSVRLTPRHTIVYGRPGQKVWREIVALS